MGLEGLWFRARCTVQGLDLVISTCLEQAISRSANSKPSNSETLVLKPSSLKVRGERLLQFRFRGAGFT